MRVLHKKLLRTLRKSWGPSLAVAMVLACGIASYIAIYSAYLNLGLTQERYYARYQFADFEIMLDRAPQTSIFKVEELPGVREARGRIVEDVNVDIEGVDESRTGRLISMPVPRRPVINDIILLEGRYFSAGAQNEVILSERFASSNNLRPGDTVQVAVEGRKYPLRIVGLGLSPEYIYMIPNVQDLFPAPEKFGIFWVPEEFAETALNMKSACNNIVGKVDEPEQLDALLEEAEHLLDAYGVFAKIERENQVSHRFISDEIKGLEVSAKITPTIFLGIAALILLVMLNRMVRTDRSQIGLMKAYGYSNVAVAFHYIEYALLLGGVGCLTGFLLGQWMARNMLHMYIQFYQFPILEFRMYPEVLVKAMGITGFFTVLGALFAALRAAQMHPAESMRPEAPRYAHKILLERWKRFWRWLTFTEKMIIRNIFRNKFRSGLNVFGVAVSTMLLLLGFFSLDCMNYAIEFQFREVQREDVKVSLQWEHGKETWYALGRFDQVRRVEPVLEYPFELRNGWRKKDMVVIGLPTDAKLQRLKTFSGEEVTIPEQGLVVTSRIARTMGLQPGSQVTLKPLMGRIEKEKTVTVAKVSEQFLGTAGYMNIEELSRILDEPFTMNAALLQINEGARRSLSKEFKDIASIGAVTYSQDAYDAIMKTIAESIYITNSMLLFFSGVIAFSIIYNITSISLAERQRELASLRVMGLTPGEVGRVLYHENMLLGIAGAVVGLPMGYVMTSMLIGLYDNDLYRLPFHIENRTFVIALLLTIGFVLLANLAVRRKVMKLDLIEVLKARE